MKATRFYTREAVAAEDSDPFTMVSPHTGEWRNLAAALVLGASVFGREGSNPSLPTMALKLDREQLLNQALSELERARLGKTENGEQMSLEFRSYLIQAATAYIQLAREVLATDEHIERQIDAIRERV